MHILYHFFPEVNAARRTMIILFVGAKLQLLQIFQIMRKYIQAMKMISEENLNGIKIVRVKIAQNMAF